MEYEFIFHKPDKYNTVKSTLKRMHELWVLSENGDNIDLKF